MEESDRTKSEIATGAADIAPRTAGRYEILREIGRGGMGIVYTARQQDLDRLVALKELHSVHLNAPGLAERFMRESRLAGSVSHPNIVTVYEYFEEGGTPFIAMEYVQRGSLRPWVGRLSLAQLAGVLEGLLAGLAAVAPAEIVHRDLKPENVMVTSDGRVKITDFGIAKASESAGLNSFMTATGTTVGTPAYMAPEQALSQPVGPWTDLYSVGVMTYEQLVGELPFQDSQGAMAILLRHVNEPIPSVAKSRPDLDPAFSEWVERMVDKDPSVRTQSAAQAWDELEEIFLELLGARWRREARLPESGSATKTQKPLTPAPFADPQLASIPDAPVSASIDRSGAPTESGRRPPSTPTPTAGPELESGLLAFGRAPTGVHQEDPTPEESALAPESFGTRETGQGSGQFASASASAPPTSSVSAQTKRGVPPQPGVTHVGKPSRAERRLPAALKPGLLAALIVVFAAAAGFLLTPSNGGGKAPVRGVAAERPTRAYAVVLGNALVKLNAARTSAGEALAHAATPGAQAAAAQRLAHAHSEAAAAVKSASPGALERDENRAIAAALSTVATGYAAMAGAARHEDRSGFDDARGTVQRGTVALDTALGQLRKLGYKLSG